MRFVALYGPPGCGKIMHARAIARALPAPTGDDAVALAWLYQRHFPERYSLVTEAPFRAPHHTCSEAALVGSMTRVRRVVGRDEVTRDVVTAGEASLAHAGTLLLDELPEFRLSSLDSLGMALWDGHRRYWDATGVQCVMPASPAVVVAAPSPCDCGWHGVDGDMGRCQCTEAQVERYRARLTRCLALVSRGRTWEWFRGGSPTAQSLDFRPMAASELGAAR